MQIRKRFIDVANTLLDDGGLPSIRAASQIVRDHFPPVERVADVADAERIEDLSDIPDEDAGAHEGNTRRGAPEKRIEGNR